MGMKTMPGVDALDMDTLDALLEIQSLAWATRRAHGLDDANARRLTGMLDDLLGGDVRQVLETAADLDAAPAGTRIEYGPVVGIKHDPRLACPWEITAQGGWTMHVSSEHVATDLDQLGRVAEVTVWGECDA